MLNFAEGLFSKMRIFGLSPTLVDYNTLMASLCKESSLEQARRLFQETRNSSCKPDIISFNIMTDGILKAGDIQSAKEDASTLYLFLIYKRAVKTWTNGTGRRCF
jgi:pentatricopeptide repeat protein